ncbi:MULTISPECIES: EAL and HDOD domain-containing protein [unclassified Halomonas]|uniref:EAL and HDOD domain-containing protein n=1 Tax=unclassified Halomonas TaxID=2609666 RepID=UPI00209F6075|nr:MULTISPECIES: EAL domain-containing protein [unclassified Halomonas]MCP1313377.1 EAL domain-containing protein [Halomonas sp. 707D7]MCP1325372.1 EAL domain-containing protein [Halomonas sp. 707D4]
MTRSVPKPASPGYTIALQPIVDVDLNHVADELLYRHHHRARTATIDDDVQATARACAVAIYEIGLETLCDQRTLFVNVSEQWLLNSELCRLPTDRIVLEVLESTPPTAAVRDAMAHLKAMGYTLALDDFQTDQDHDSLLDHCHIVKFDVSRELPLAQIESLRAQGFTLLAERVETHEAFDRCKALGFSLFQGYFYERPRIQRSHVTRRDASSLTHLLLITKLYRSEIDVDDLSRLIAKDTYLTEAVLKRAGAATHADASACATLETSIERLGVVELRMLVTITLLASHGPASKLEVIKGLTRALACQRVASERRVDEEEGFMLGLFSHMPMILDVELETLIQELPLTLDQAKALTQRAGRLGALLSDVESAELGEPVGTLPDTLLEEAEIEAQRWMNKTHP